MEFVEAGGYTHCHLNHLSEFLSVILYLYLLGWNLAAPNLMDDAHSSLAFLEALFSPQLGHQGLQITSG